MLCQCHLCEFTRGKINSETYKQFLEKKVSDLTTAIKSSEYEKEQLEYEKEHYRKELKKITEAHHDLPKM